MDDLSEICWLIERTKVIEAVVGVLNAMDAKDWPQLQDYLADEIEVDYSDFRGELPRRITASDYVQQRIDGLANLQTLHISTNHEVTLAEDTAKCRSAYQIYRIDPARELGQERLDTAGNYVHQLSKISGKWRITAIKQTVAMISGNRQVHGAFRSSL
jgi:hypothetical protein